MAKNEVREQLNNALIERDKYDKHNVWWHYYDGQVVALEKVLQILK